MTVDCKQYLRRITRFQNKWLLTVYSKNYSALRDEGDSLLSNSNHLCADAGVGAPGADARERGASFGEGLVEFTSWFHSLCLLESWKVEDL
jgi:hypothetical protein